MHAFLLHQWYYSDSIVGKKKLLELNLEYNNSEVKEIHWAYDT
jgi:hypothetical protein